MGVALLAMVAGCVLPLASDTSLVPSGSVAGADSSGVPRLTQPELDIAPFVDAPCTLLTGPQLAALGITVAGRVEDTVLGKSCRWIATDTPAKVDLSLDINTKLGLAGLYARKMIYSVWEPLQIAGYPAARSDDAEEHAGECRINLAISGTVLVAVDLNLKSGETKPPDFADPCPRAAKALAQVVAALRNPR